MNKHNIQNAKLLEELNKNMNTGSDVEVLSVNDNQTKDEILRSIKSKKKGLMDDALDRLHRAISRYDITAKNVDKKVEKPYRQQILDIMTKEVVASIGKKTFWSEYTPSDRLRIWNKLKTQVEEMDIESVIDYIIKTI